MQEPGKFIRGAFPHQYLVEEAQFSTFCKQDWTASK
jgi:hypothetical protein